MKSKKNKYREIHEALYSLLNKSSQCNRLSST